MISHEQHLRNAGYDFDCHRPVRRAVLVRGYDNVTRTVAHKREVACPAGLCRILTTEGFRVLGPLDGYEPFTLAVENDFGRYAVDVMG